MSLNNDAAFDLNANDLLVDPGQMAGMCCQLDLA